MSQIAGKLDVKAKVQRKGEIVARQILDLSKELATIAMQDSSLALLHSLENELLLSDLSKVRGANIPALQLDSILVKTRDFK